MPLDQPDFEPPAVNETRAAALSLIERSKTCLLGTLDEQGIVDLRAMLNLKHEGLRKIWFSTNTSSRKVAQLKINPGADVYYYYQEKFEGLRLSGRILLRQDVESREMLWSEGAELYYPHGVSDPDYTVLEFRVETASYYSDLKNTILTID